MEIIGKESPAIIGLPCAETWQTIETSDEGTSSADSLKELSASSEIENASTSTLIKKSLPKRRVDFAADTSDSEAIFKEKKQRLAIEIMEKESYLKTLEILKLERELGLPASKFTDHLPQSENVFYVVNDCEGVSKQLSSDGTQKATI